MGFVLTSIAFFILSFVSTARATSDETCRLVPLVNDFEVHAVHVSDRFWRTLAQTDEGIVVAEDVEVIVSKTERPIILVLSSSVEVIWTLGLAPGARLAGIIAVGSKSKGLVGVARTVPFLDLDSKEWRRQCSSMSFRLGESESERERANNAVGKITGKAIAEIHFGDKNPTIFIGDPPEDLVEIQREESSIGLQSYKDLSEIFGRDGLIRLSESGYLRPAEPVDIAAWRAAAGDTVDQNLSSLAQVPIENILVVEGPLELPDGLIGSEAITFLIAGGVPMPTGPRGDNLFYSMTDFTCHPQCGR